MDPILPIGNQPPTIPRVAPAPRTRRVERDASRPDDLDGRGRKQRPHVDVTA